MDCESLALSEYLRELEDLVNVDSVSSEPSGTGRIAARLAEKYAALGWTVRSHRVADTAGPCLEIYNREAECYDVLLLAHMDTVFPPGTAARRPFAVRGERAYGPGVIDCKGGLLSGFYALQSLERAGSLGGKAVCVFLNSDHEGISSRYSRVHTERLAKRSRCALVLEAARANGNLVHKRKGIARYLIEVEGVAAHAGVDHAKGRSAVEELAHWVLALQRRTDYAKETTLNVGTIAGGVSVSAVPAEARAALDVRFYEAAEAEAVERLLGELAAHPHVAGTAARVAGGVTRPPMLPTERTLALCRDIDAIGERLGVAFGWTASGGGSDGSFAAAAGTPTIDGLGPVGGGAHSAEEYLEIASVAPRCRLLRETIAHILRKQ